jgi:hypothetical protein
LICFDKFALLAVGSEPAYPIKINLDRAPRKMASPPQLNDGAFAVVTTFHIHAIFDVQTAGTLSRVDGTESGD